jgi:hypothetical protein
LESQGLIEVMDAGKGPAGPGFFRMDLTDRTPLSNLTFNGPGRVAVMDRDGQILSGAAENAGSFQILASVPCVGPRFLQALEDGGFLAFCTNYHAPQVWLLPPDSSLAPEERQPLVLARPESTTGRLTPLDRGLWLLANDSGSWFLVVNFPETVQ